jgi:hypothetical protein
MTVNFLSIKSLGVSAAFVSEIRRRFGHKIFSGPMALPGRNCADMVVRRLALRRRVVSQLEGDANESLRAQDNNVHLDFAHLLDISRRVLHIRGPDKYPGQAEDSAAYDPGQTHGQGGSRSGSQDCHASSSQGSRTVNFRVTACVATRCASCAAAGFGHVASNPVQPALDCRQRSDSV